MTAPESWGPDEWIDPWAPVDRLHQMPLLAAQARELGQTRNPDGDRRAQRSHSAGSRPAARLDLIDVADDTTEARGELRALILWCSRPIWEGVDHDTRSAHPQPLGTPTWETDAQYQRANHHTTQPQALEPPPQPQNQPQEPRTDHTGTSRRDQLRQALTDAHRAR